MYPVLKTVDFKKRQIGVLICLKRDHLKLYCQPQQYKLNVNVIRRKDSNP